jgi:septal ring factor EnvC (AmiA/AmiB activator)
MKQHQVEQHQDQPHDYSKQLDNYGRNLAANTLSIAVWVAALISAITTGAVTLIIHGYDITNPAALMGIRSTKERLDQLEQRMADLEANLQGNNDDSSLVTTLADLRAEQQRLQQSIETMRIEQVRLERQTRSAEDRLADVECDLIQHNLQAYGTRGLERGDYRVDPATCQADAETGEPNSAQSNGQSSDAQPRQIIPANPNPTN